MQIYSNSCYMVELLWTGKFLWTNNIIIMVLRFDVRLQLLASAYPWQIASRFDNIERKLLISYQPLLALVCNSPTKLWP